MATKRAPMDPHPEPSTEALPLEQLLEQAEVALIQFNPTGEGIYVNQPWRRLTGCNEPLPISGEILLGLVHPDDRERLLRAWSESTSPGDSFDFVTRFLLADGSVRTVHGHMVALPGDGDHPSGYVAALTDIGLGLSSDRREGDLRYRALHHQAPVGLVVANLDGSIIETNQTMAEILGVTPADLVGRYPWELVHPDDVARVMALFSELTGHRRAVVSDEVRMLAAGGEVRWVVGGASLVRDSAGEPEAVQAVVLDTTDRHDAEQRLRRREERYRTVVDALQDGILILDDRGEIETLNHQAASLLGITVSENLSSEQLDYVSSWRFFDADGRELGLQELPIWETLRGGELLHDLVFGIERPGEDRVWMQVNSVPLEYPDRDRRGAVLTLRDITRRMRAESETRRLARIVESSSDIVGMIDPGTSRLIYLNSAARELLKLGAEDVGSIDARDLYSPASRQHWESEIAVALEMQGTWTGELELITRDGRVVDVLQSVVADRDEGGLIHQISFVASDIEEQRRREVDLTHQATHDPLTDLPNRTLLIELIDHALARARHLGRLVAVVFLDLDRFKLVNDNMGHEVGDDLLRAVADRIAGSLRPSDVLSRLGGDEFVVLCDEIHDELQAVAVTQRIMSAIESHPFEVAGSTVSLSASAGIALSTDSESHAESLLRDADAAMYRAKERGRARHELFDEGMRKRTARRLKLADELQNAIEQGQITVHFQPVIDLSTGRVEAVEALARWEHPERGTLPPWEFIELAEETGLIVGLGLSVLSLACEQYRHWEVELGSRAPKVHVNLSARQLTHTNLPRLVQGVLDQSLMAPDRLCLEVTESVLMEDVVRSAAALEDLKGIGVELAIDDFGTGYSSLSYLRRFPVDVIKIDRTFIDGLGPDPDDSAIVSAIVNLANTLELSSVAEGVETAEQLSGLRALGCHAAQGFYFARPMPAPEVNRYLTTVYPVANGDDREGSRPRKRRRRRL